MSKYMYKDCKKLLILIILVFYLINQFSVFAIDNTANQKSSISNTKISYINNIGIVVKKDSNYKLPKTMDARMTDESLKKVEVKWDNANYNTNIIGTYPVYGTVKGYNKKVKIEIIVSDFDINNNDINLNYSGNKVLNYDYMVDQKDTDGDGLTDYEEVNKYCTNPNKKDSDNDGIIDSDWNERREYTYTITAKRELKTPFNSASLKDTFQDIRIISETKDKLIYEAILYPYARDIVEGNKNWESYGNNPAFKELLVPRKTTNWDKEMQKKIVDSIPKDCITDLDVVEFLNSTYFIGRETVPNPDKAEIYSGDFLVDLRYNSPIINDLDLFRSLKKDPKLSDVVFMKQLCFGKAMFDDKICGACTQNATYMTTVLRAVGIPARIIETNDLMNSCDPKQMKLLAKLKNEKIRKPLIERKPTYAGHYYIEAYVGGRWIKINNSGKIMESNYIDEDGVFLIKADTFFDYADTGMVDLFKDSKYVWSHMTHPYALLDISDQFGKYYDEKNQPWRLPRLLFGIDFVNNDGVYVFDSGHENESNYWKFINNKLSSFSIKMCASIDNFNNKILYSNNVIVISTNVDYNKLPNLIQSNIKKESYNMIEMDDYINIKINNANVLLIKK